MAPAEHTVVTVTHAGFIVTAFLSLFALAGRGEGRRAWLDPVHTAVTEWRAAGQRWELVRYNDAAHLAQQT